MGLGFPDSNPAAQPLNRRPLLLGVTDPSPSPKRPRAKPGPKPKPKDPSKPKPKRKPQGTRPRTTTVEVPAISVRTALTPEVHAALVEQVRKGRTQRQAAALCRVPLSTFKRWLIEGRRDVDAGTYDTQAAALAVEVEHALAEHEGKLIDEIEEAIADGQRVADGSKWVRWKVGILSPNDFAPATASTTEGTVFELVSPDDAAQSLREKLEAFLAAHEAAIEADAEAAAAPLSEEGVEG